MDITRHRTDFWIRNNTVDVAVKELEGAVAAHWHEFYELEVILEGAGIYTVDGVDYRIDAGSLFFMSQSSCHSILFTEPTRLITLMFTLEACEPNFLYGLFESVPHLALRAGGEDLSFLRVIAEEMTRAESVPYLSAMLHSVLGKVRSLCAAAETPVKNSAMQYALLYVQNHFKEHIRLGDVARMVNYSPNYFGNRFKEYTGISFKSYLLQLQFSLAEQLLVGTSLSVSEICERCGFSDYSNFATYFKERQGVTPTEYRKRKGTIGSVT